MSDRKYKFGSANEQYMTIFLSDFGFERRGSEIVPINIPENFPRDPVTNRPEPVAYYLIGNGIRIPSGGSGVLISLRNTLAEKLKADPIVDELD